MNEADRKSWSPILSGIETLGDFFGVSLDKVSTTNRYIAIYANRPDWLRNLTDEKLLPRRVIRFDLAHRFTAPPGEGDRAQRIAWIVDFCHGDWNMTDRWVWFDNDVDAVHYSLRWE